MDKSETSLEEVDADLVDKAIKALGANNVDEAQAILLTVVQNTPKKFVLINETKDSLEIKFWDKKRFIHYTEWQWQHGMKKDVYWAGNAYPRALYYLGFICVKKKQYEKSITYLEQGKLLEPTNPLFNFELSHAHIQSGRAKKALQLYDEISEVGPFVDPLDMAMALRGRGGALIEMRRLDAAMEAYQRSLEFEPENYTALNELKYIEHLRLGGGGMWIYYPSQAEISLYAPCAVPN